MQRFILIFSVLPLSYVYLQHLSLISLLEFTMQHTTTETISSTNLTQLRRINNSNLTEVFYVIYGFKLDCDFAAKLMSKPYCIIITALVVWKRMMV